MLNEIKGLNEECGIFGVFNSPHANQLTYIGLHALQHRGQEGAGIVTVDDDHCFYQHRDRGLLSEVFKDQNDLDRLKGQTAIGHVRTEQAAIIRLRMSNRFFLNLTMVI